MAFISIVLFLIGSTWWIELGGLEREHVQFLKTTLHQSQLESQEYLGRHVVRFKVDFPNSEKAPPIAAIAPILNALSTMGFSLVSHNDEYKPNPQMTYLTWMLQKDVENLIVESQHQHPSS